MVKNVLIIDSDTVHRGMLACMLPAEGYALRFARNAAEAFEQLQGQPPDLLLVGHSDEMADFCQRLRSRRATRDVPLIIMDERFADEAVTLEVAEAAGADAALPFPFRLEQLEDRLRMLGAGGAQAISTKLMWGRAPADDAPEAPAVAERPLPTPEDNTASWQPFRERVAQLCRALDDKDYYELLGVPHDAPTAAVKAAYFDLSIAFHPDRYMMLEDAELKQQVYTVFKRCTEAFKVLLDPSSRADYDRQRAEGADEVRYLDFGRPRLASDASSPSQTPAGRRYLHFAELAERNGNLRSARMYLTLATQCEPDNLQLRGRLDAITARISG